MVLSKQEIQDSYQSGAKYYDFFVKFYRLIGFNIETYRSRAIELLHLEQGDCVVELGCGTGLNFPLILEQIGPQGRLIGVDLTAGMLACAQDRIKQIGWKNVELVQSDIVEYNFPESVNKVLSTGVFGFVAGYDNVIESLSHTIVPGGRLVIMDGKQPKHWPLWLLKIFVNIGRPFGLTLRYLENRTWESVERYFYDTVMEERYGGCLFISAGTTLSSKT